MNCIYSTNRYRLIQLIYKIIWQELATFTNRCHAMYTADRLQIRG